MHPSPYSRAVDDKVLVTSRTFTVIGIGRIDMSEGERTNVIEKDREMLKRGRYVESTKVGRDESSRSETGIKIKRGRIDACVSVNGARLSVARHDSLFLFLVVAVTRVPARHTRGASVLDRRLCREIRVKPMRVYSYR